MFTIHSKLHGIIDYAVVVFLCLSPKVFGLPELTSIFTYVLAGIHLLLTVTTDFEAGIFRLIPLKVHGWVELLVSIALVGVAFYLGSLEGTLPRTYYLCFALAVFLTWLLTDYKGRTGSAATGN